MGSSDTFCIHNQCRKANAGVDKVVRVSCRPLRNDGFICKLEEEHGTKWLLTLVALPGASAVPTRVFLV